MATLYPPVVTVLPAASVSTTKTTAAITTPDAYGITLEQYWLGQIADTIILTAKSGKKFVDVEGHRVTTANASALTTAGYTLTPATFNPTTVTATIIPDQVRISWP